MWYAHQPGRRTRQIIGDGAVLLWTGGWAAAAVLAHRARSGAGGGLHGLPGAGGPMPLVGGHGALRDVAFAEPASIGVLAVVSAAVVFVVPVGLVLAVWLPRRMRWVRQAAAARDLAATEDGRELLALRTLLRPLDDVGRTAGALPDSTPGSLAEGWREGDPATLDALAEAELTRLGLTTP
jgi:hypothetical protein